MCQSPHLELIVRSVTRLWALLTNQRAFYYHKPLLDQILTWIFELNWVWTFRNKSRILKRQKWIGYNSPENTRLRILQLREKKSIQNNLCILWSKCLEEWDGELIIFFNLVKVMTETKKVARKTKMTLTMKIPKIENFLQFSEAQRNRHLSKKWQNLKKNSWTYPKSLNFDNATTGSKEKWKMT